MNRLIKDTGTHNGHFMTPMQVLTLCEWRHYYNRKERNPRDASRYT